MTFVTEALISAYLHSSGCDRQVLAILIRPRQICKGEPTATGARRSLVEKSLTLWSGPTNEMGLRTRPTSAPSPLQQEHEDDWGGAEISGGVERSDK
jgi:hypothetical protein